MSRILYFLIISVLFKLLYPIYIYLYIGMINIIYFEQSVNSGVRGIIKLKKFLTRRRRARRGLRVFGKLNATFVLFFIINEIDSRREHAYNQ